MRDGGLRTITDITRDSHVTTQGHYIQNAGLMIAARTVEGVRMIIMSSFRVLFHYLSFFSCVRVFFFFSEILSH